MAKFPDLTGDGQVTQADILKGRGVYKKGGSVMKHDHGHKPMVKMSHGGHYCWGGKVMKKAEGGDVKKVMAKDKNFRDDLTEDSKKSMGLPISVYDKGKYDPKASRKIMNENFEEGLRQEREEFGKKMKDEYGDTRDYSFKYPSESYNSDLPQGKSYKTKATEGMKRGGMAKGGNWIQSAIKKPGALKKSLGVPMDKPIPAGKLKTASKAPGKMGQRARLAMTLKGMK